MNIPKTLFLASLLAVVSFGCKPKQLIPPGKYVAGKESVVITGSSISFRIKLKDSPPNTFWTRVLDYTLYSDGEIITHTMNSAEYFKTLLPFKWHWDGKNIVRTTMPTGTKTVFSLQKTDEAIPALSEKGPVEPSPIQEGLEKSPTGNH